MHLKSSDPRAADIVHVLCNGKRVNMAVELDTDEGWVDVILPKVDPKAELVEAGGLDKVSDRYFEADKDGNPVEKTPAPSVEWETKRLHGEVKVIFREDTKPSSN